MAGEAGFEPTSTVLETAELPLFYSPKKAGSPLGGDPAFGLGLISQEP